MAGLDPRRLCLVTDRRRLAAATGRPLADASALVVEQAAVAARAGVGAVQLREPDLDGAALFVLTRAVRDVLGPATHLLVNDRADVAAAAGVGVHLKEQSIPADRARAALPSLGPIWRAVHDAAGARTAGPVDALVAGTVFATPSKAAGTPTLGVAGLAAIVAASAVPVYAIGGLGGASWLVAAPSGAYGCAAIGTFLPRPGEDIAQAIGRAVRGFADGVD